MNFFKTFLWLAFQFPSLKRLYIVLRQHSNFLANSSWVIGNPFSIVFAFLISIIFSWSSLDTCVINFTILFIYLYLYLYSIPSTITCNRGIVSLLVSLGGALLFILSWCLATDLLSLFDEANVYICSFLHKSIAY